MRPRVLLNLDPDFTYIGCIPVWASPTHPTDQSPCTLEACPHCDKTMWVSEKKYAMRDKSPDKVKMYCLYCLMYAVSESDIQHELADINDFN